MVGTFWFDDFPDSNLHQDSSSKSDVKAGAFYTVSPTAWGLLPITGRLWIPAVEVLSHRIIWSMVFLLGLLLLQKQRRSELGQLKAFEMFGNSIYNCLHAYFLTGDFTSRVNTDQVVETSLGYFINPW